MAAATRRRPAIIVAAGLLLGLLAVNLQGVQGEELEKVPSEDQCRPYIEKALKHLGTEGSEEEVSPDGGGEDDAATGDAHDYGGQRNDDETGADAIDPQDDESTSREKRSVSAEQTSSDGEVDQVETVEVTSVEDEDERETNSVEAAHSAEEDERSTDERGGSGESKEDERQPEEAGDSAEDRAHEEDDAVIDQSSEQKEDDQDDADKSEEAKDEDVNDAEPSRPSEDEEATSKEESDETPAAESAQDDAEEPIADDSDKPAEQQHDDDSKEEAAEEAKSVEDELEVVAEKVVSMELQEAGNDAGAKSEVDDKSADEESREQQQAAESRGHEDETSEEARTDGSSNEEREEEEEGGGGDEGQESASPEEEELIMEIEVPEILRPRDHIGQLLKLDEENEEKEKAVERIAEIVLRDLKRLYDNAIKPLETLYKYRDLSNRHFGDPEIFSKPLVLFMGPWSGGKSSIINYLLDIEYKSAALRTGAEPSPAYFNILMHGEEEEVLDGTQLAADWTFSGLQKFGQGLLDRLRGYKLPSKLLEKVNIVEIPGILEIRKQVQRLFPFNDACQWFIDRADIIFLVYDPSKLDVGPETEAILDQLKGREYQTRIILNKADQVKPEELMRVQGALIWNISPLMSSAEPPIMYSTSLWSIPYEAGAPTRLLYAQERAFLRDLRSAIDKRVEHKIASARRFAVRVRNHAKMVDCYLTTYYNHKSFFAKKKDVAERIIDSPQDYHIYEGLSTLTNISRYDLPDPDVYRDFFRLNNLYEFPLLSSTCTYFRGCPINRLDVAIAYDLPELVGKYKKSAEAALLQADQADAAATAAPASASPAAPAQAQAHKAKSGASKLSLS